MTVPRIKALGPLLLGVPYHPVNNPLLFNLAYPGHPQDGSSITLNTFKQIKKEIL